MEKALAIIDAALTFGINPSLEPIRRICKLLGKPQEQFKSIQLAGTNGKSSTSRYLAALLLAQEHSVGLYTSPELVAITERIEVDGEPVSDESFAHAVITVHETALADDLELTEFELITAAALLLFAEAKVEYAVLEVGLGGRWDATSVVHPELAVFTSVDLDHTAILGNSIAEIAEEKAAIIEEGTQVVIAPTHPEAMDIFRTRADELHAPWIEVPLAKQQPGSYQAQNRLTALTAACELLGMPLDVQKAEAIMQATIIPGRMEILQEDPLLIIDAAHNPASARVLARSLDLPQAILLLAILSDKDARGIIEELVPHFAKVVVTQTRSPRALPAKELARLVGERCNNIMSVVENPGDALELLLAQDQPIVATGSITLAGEVKALHQKIASHGSL